VSTFKISPRTELKDRFQRNAQNFVKNFLRRTWFRELIVKAKFSRLWNLGSHVCFAQPARQCISGVVSAGRESNDKHRHVCGQIQPITFQNEIELIIIDVNNVRRGESRARNPQVCDHRNRAGQRRVAAVHQSPMSERIQNLEKSSLEMYIFITTLRKPGTKRPVHLQICPETRICQIK
jgi:hypothetical protein